MMLRTRVFELSNEKYADLSALARAMGISQSQLYRVKRGMCPVNERFIIGAAKAFPGYKLDDLLYVAPRAEARMSTDNRRDEILRLRETGLTYAEIGRRLGITRERVWQIFMRVRRVSTKKKPSLDSKVMLTTSEATQLLGVRPNTVRRWNNKGILKAYRISPRGDRRFRRQDIDGFLKEAEIE